MVDAIDPARLDSLPADLRAAFEAQARALAETSLQLDIERKARLHRDAEKSDLEVKNSGLEAKNSISPPRTPFSKKSKRGLSTWCTSCAGRGLGRARRSSIWINSSWPLRTSRSRSQKSGIRRKSRRGT